MKRERTAEGGISDGNKKRKRLEILTILYYLSYTMKKDFFKKKDL